MASAFSSDPNRGSAQLCRSALATPASRERRRIQCETRTASFDVRRRVTGRRLAPAPACSRAPAVSRNRRRAHTSTTTHTDFCNRYEARAHWRTIEDPALRRFSRRCAAPRGAPAMRHRTGRSAPESAPCEARKPALALNWTSLSPAPAPVPWRVAELIRSQPRPTFGFAARTDEPSETSQDAFRRARSVRFYSTRTGRALVSSRPPCPRASFRQGSSAGR